MYRIICLVITLYSSLAADVTVYGRLDYVTAEPQTLLEPVAVSQFPWKFGFASSDAFSMDIFIINKSPSVTAINVTCTIDDTTFEMQNTTRTSGQRKGQEYYYTVFDTLYTAEIQIQLNLYSSKIVCSSFVVAKGRKFSKILTKNNESLKKEFPQYNFGGYGCAVVVDLVNKCVYKVEENAEGQSSQNIVLIYLIPSVGMCIIIVGLVIYLISRKKYCHRNSHPVETIEFNTYSTANEVVYADLGFERGDSHPPRREEERGDSQPPRREEDPIYAQITGVLKPADGNTKNK